MKKVTAKPGTEARTPRTPRTPRTEKLNSLLSLKTATLIFVYSLPYILLYFSPFHPKLDVPDYSMMNGWDCI